MQNIKNIIFDLGGIFIAIDYPSTERAFSAMGVANFGGLFTHHDASPLFELLETGKITPEEFYDRFRQASGLSLNNDQIRTAWNAMLGEFFLDGLEWMQQLKPHYNIFLFSNTNQIHADAFLETFRRQTGVQDFDGYFKKAYYSHKLGIRKPYPESFKAIIAEQNLIAEETVFIDDSLKNVQGAIEAGLQGIFLEPPRKVTELAELFSNKMEG